ncbi:hypothetical protein BRADI_3g27110v3 [Brachypodium distachyon]|uniref:Uncharacterized protein n=1 Tax=Brachypodium distachyon TaxID=15368 RepID=I1I451_BRADI|nr:hypothetical protein BRADI_3g27110v3 [Brachypodium distachyon]KQJ96786.1 hypothetical protein BRADI_3g27110v3 [Brachypodium distachyon]
MATTTLQELKDIFFGHVLGKKGEAVQELEVSIRAKGNVTPAEDVILRLSTVFSNFTYTVTAAATTVLTSFATGQVQKFGGGPPLPRFVRFGICAGGGLVTGKVLYYVSLHAFAEFILAHKEEKRLKMELANIILTNHSDEKFLVQAVQKHFFAEHLYSDQHQDKPLFRWRQRHSYVDSTYMERLKEIEANNSEDKVKTISGQAAVKKI